MRASVSTRRDRTLGFILLALAIVVPFLPRFDFAGQPMKLSLVWGPWICAAILLFSINAAARPNPRLIRWAAGILFIAGLVSPYLANFIDSSLGA